MNTNNQTNASESASDFIKSVLGDTPNNDSYNFTLSSPSLHHLLDVVSRQESELAELKGKAAPLNAAE